VTTRKVTMLECDNPGCSNEYEHSKDDPAPGYHLGKGYWIVGGGGPIPATYACSPECITPAVLHNISEARR
jgi:hypothetical protein